MNPRTYLVCAVMAASLSLSSCSGVKTPCTNCGGGGGLASLSLTLAAAPLVPPPGTSLLSFAVTINSVSLTPASGGSAVNIPLNTATYSVDLTRLQSDSSFLGQVMSNVPTGTYNKVTVGVTSAVVTYCTAGSGTPGCTSGSVAQLTSGAGAPATSSFSLALTSGEKAGLQVVFNIGNAITVNPTTQVVSAVNLAAANVVTAVPLPPPASTLSTGQLDYIEDVTGVVTAATSSSVTVQTSTRGPITSLLTSSTILSPNCVITNVTCSPVVGQIASIDATLNADGTSTMLEYDPLSVASIDVIEGIVTTVPSSSTQFQIVTNDFIAATSNSKIGSGLSLGDPVQVTYTAVNPFVIDTKGLLPLTATPFSGSTSANDILPGQTVALRVTAFTPKSGTTPAAATVDFVVLRFTRVAGTVSSSSAPTFGIQNLPLFFGQTGTGITLVQLSTTTTPITYLDGYTTGSNITVGDNVAVRALYFGVGFSPSFLAAKVRKH